MQQHGNDALLLVKGNIPSGQLGRTSRIAASGADLLVHPSKVRAPWRSNMPRSFRVKQPASLADWRRRVSGEL